MADKPRRRIAVFDFDGTLVKEDTFLTFALHALGPWSTALGLLRSLPSIIGWKLGLVDNSRAKTHLFAALYKGREKSRLTEAALTFNPHYRSEVLSELKAARTRGDTVYIISASLDLWLSEQAGRLGVHLLCTNAETGPGEILTGRFATPNCTGPEKASRLLAAEPDRESYHLTVYGDSDGDTALLAMADTPILLQ